jgi:hypothetical protein
MTRRVLALLALLSACSDATSSTNPSECDTCDAAAFDASIMDGSSADAGTDSSIDSSICTTCVDSGCASCTDSGPPATTGALPRLVAYVNCLCGFGIGANGGACLADPDPNVNHIESWETAGTSPITHYVISFLSFSGSEIQTDPGEIWASGGGKTNDFALHANLARAMRAAQAKGKKVMLSIGGEVGSSGFLGWWRALGSTSAERVTAMHAKLEAVAQKFETANGVRADGFDVDIELGGVYDYASDKYVATRDLINAVDESRLVAFVPQIGNGLCAAPNVGDPLPPPAVLGGQCSQPMNGDDTPWVLARLDKDCKKANSTPKLDYFGIQYYNAGTAECCGGGNDPPSMATSTLQSYANLANGWPASGDTTQAGNPWHQWAYYPGPWAAFAGFGADRLVLGKPGCQGCAGSNYLDLATMQSIITSLDRKLAKTMGGILFWDLCRLFGNTGPQCVSGTCQPSWGGHDVLSNLSDLKARMAALKTR